jgi:hypothetical protein
MCGVGKVNLAGFVSWPRRNAGLIASGVVNTTEGYAERESAKVMIADAKQAAIEKAQITLGADKGYDAAELIDAMTNMKVALM